MSTTFTGRKVLSSIAKRESEVLFAVKNVTRIGKCLRYLRGEKFCRQLQSAKVDVLFEVKKMPHGLVNVYDIYGAKSFVVNCKARKLMFYLK